MAGDFHDADSVDATVPGHDAVIITASVSALSELKRTPDYFSRGTQYCIDAMKKHGVKRLVVLSASTWASGPDDHLPRRGPRKRRAPGSGTVQREV